MRLTAAPKWCLFNLFPVSNTCYLFMVGFYSFMSLRYWKPLLLCKLKKISSSNVNGTCRIKMQIRANKLSILESGSSELVMHS